MKETLRVYGPATMNFHQKILKTYTPGPYTFNKGDFVLIPYSTLQTKSEFFAGKKTFDPSIYKEEKKIRYFSKSVLILFSAG